MRHSADGERPRPPVLECPDEVSPLTPDIFLLTVVFKQDCFTVCVQRSSAGQNPSPNIHCQFDVSAERLKYFCHLLLGGPGTYAMNHGFALGLSP